MSSSDLMNLYKYAKANSDSVAADQGAKDEGFSKGKISSNCDRGGPVCFNMESQGSDGGTHDLQNEPENWAGNYENKSAAYILKQENAISCKSSQTFTGEKVAPSNGDKHNENSFSDQVTHLCNNILEEERKTYQNTANETNKKLQSLQADFEGQKETMHSLLECLAEKDQAFDSVSTELQDTLLKLENANVCIAKFEGELKKLSNLQIKLGGVYAIEQELKTHHIVAEHTQDLLATLQKEIRDQAVGMKEMFKTLESIDRKASFVYTNLPQALKMKRDSQNSSFHTIVLLFAMVLLFCASLQPRIQEVIPKL